MRRRLTLVFILALMGLALVGRAGAATFTVTNTNNAGTGSLRTAIQGANATSAADTIRFAIPGAGGHMISVTSPLPAIAHPLVINGQSQPGYNGVPLVQLDNGAGPGAIGFDVSAGPSKVLGLSITRFLIGVRLQTGDANAVAGDWIGLDTSGAAAGNGTGLVIKSGSASNTIGGTTGSLRNIVSGNQLGIQLTGSGVTGNTLIGNCIGLGAACTDAVPNAGNGLEISGGAAGNRIGGTSLPARNAISGNGGDGLLISGASTSNNLVVGNYFGPDGADDEVFDNPGNIAAAQHENPPHEIRGLTVRQPPRSGRLGEQGDQAVRVEPVRVERLDLVHGAVGRGERAASEPRQHEVCAEPSDLLLRKLHLGLAFLHAGTVTPILVYVVVEGAVYPVIAGRPPLNLSVVTRFLPECFSYFGVAAGGAEVTVDHEGFPCFVGFARHPLPRHDRLGLRC